MKFPTMHLHKEISQQFSGELLTHNLPSFLNCPKTFLLVSSANSKNQESSGKREAQKNLD